MDISSFPMWKHARLEIGFSGTNCYILEGPEWMLCDLPNLPREIGGGRNAQGKVNPLPDIRKMQVNLKGKIN